MYTNTLENVSSDTLSCEETIFSVIGMEIRDPFLCCGISTKIPQKPFCDRWRIFNDLGS